MATLKFSYRLPILVKSGKKIIYKRSGIFPTYGCNHKEIVSMKWVYILCQRKSTSTLSDALDPRRVESTVTEAKK
uniref:Uncharacterized protein n=1 Tax=Romanomermis culicivorax TaxID=13658 RepID=A0A915IPN3_ROMCU